MWYFFSGTKAFFLSVLCVFLAMLSKEQGVTVVAVCCIYEAFIVQKVAMFLLITWIWLKH